MHPAINCPNQNCPNRGVLIIDANILFYLIEGTIIYVQNNFPAFGSNTDRLPQIITELRNHLGIMRDCCSTDHNLLISERILVEEVIEVNPRSKGLPQLRKYTVNERRQIMQVLREFFPTPVAINDDDIQDLRGIFPNPEIRPDDRDASLMVLACMTNDEDQQIKILSSDPDFSVPIYHLIQSEDVSIGGITYSTNFINREYINFIRQLHDCCILSSDRFTALATAFHTLLVRRLQNVRRKETRNKDVQRLQTLFQVLSISLLNKGI